MFKFLKWVTLALTSLFLVGIVMIGCRKEETTTLQNEDIQVTRLGPDLNDVTSEEETITMSLACGTPSSVSVQWYWSNGCNCNVKFKCGAVPNATMYTWEIHQVWPWGIDPNPYFTKNTTTNSWNWAGGYGQPDNFQVWVKAKCGFGVYGQFKKSITTVPPPCCSYQ